MLNLDQVKKDPQVKELIKQTEIAMGAIGYTEHGLPHANLVASRARAVAKKIGLSSREEELAAISGFCHDMGNFMSREYHNYFGSLLFHQIFNEKFKPKEMFQIVQAISNHDKAEMNFTNKISAILVLADKSDVRRSRVMIKSVKEIKNDIHNRVNFATKESILKVNKKKKTITLMLSIDSKSVPVMEYFEIFTKRMVYCRQAAKYLNYHFGLIINKFKLL